MFPGAESVAEGEGPPLFEGALSVRSKAVDFAG